jgi:hypothetical protein
MLLSPNDVQEIGLDIMKVRHSKRKSHDTTILTANKAAVLSRISQLITLQKPLLFSSSIRQMDHLSTFLCDPPINTRA